MKKIMALVAILGAQSLVADIGLLPIISSVSGDPYAILFLNKNNIYGELVGDGSGWNYADSLWRLFQTQFGDQIPFNPKDQILAHRVDRDRSHPLSSKEAPYDVYFYYINDSFDDFVNLVKDYQSSLDTKTIFGLALVKLSELINNTVTVSSLKEMRQIAPLPFAEQKLPAGFISRAQLPTIDRNLKTLLGGIVEKAKLQEALLTKIEKIKTSLAPQKKPAEQPRIQEEQAGPAPVEQGDTSRDQGARESGIQSTMTEQETAILRCLSDEK